MTDENGGIFMPKKYNTIIIGGGTAGLTAAIYTARQNKSVAVFESGIFGGQIVDSPRIENYPGFCEISGDEFSDRLLKQALKLGAELIKKRAAAIKLEGEDKYVISADGEKTQCDKIIIAVGTRPRPLYLENERELLGRGISYCAVCDGAFYKGRAVAVNGGGNSALQDAMLLSDTCSKVYLIHRRDTFRGEAKLVEALKARDNVELVLNSSITELLGQDELCAIRVADNEGGERELAVDGLFVAIGHAPDNEIFSSLIDLDETGYADSDESCVTRTPGVFVAGDCRKKTVRQLTTAAADGSAAALAACRYIDSLD